MAWMWRYETEGGGSVDVPAMPARQSYPTQGDAESWLGENWKELLSAGVAQVTLLEGDREVYGPMGLAPAD